MTPIKICLVSAEVAPFAKTGGLADVAASLARFLAKKKHDVRVVMPMYTRVRSGEWKFEPVYRLQDIPMQCGGRKHWFSVSTSDLPESKTKVWFIRCPALFERESLYTSDADEHVRFSLLSRAAIEMCQWTKWAPDIFHVNDWHTALVPLYLRTVYGWDKLFARSRSVLTIHNIGYQGVFSDGTLDDLGLANERRLLYQEDLRDGKINFMKTGILYANALTTVSETYAKEIQGDDFGMGLAPLLRTRKDALFGIVNGVDYEAWNPKTDKLIPHKYSSEDLRGKAACKKDLLAHFKIPAQERTPLFGIISRLTFQKGFEILSEVLPVLFHREDLRLVVLGSGEEKYERFFKWMQTTFPKKVAYTTGYQEKMAHWIESASDIFLMPSRYEPCGLNQMYSLKYGTVPIVRKTGGLADTVVDHDPAKSTGTGFVFEDFLSDALLHAVSRALRVYRDPTAWKKLMLEGMAQDFSWDKEGRHYLDLYKKLMPA